MGERARGSEEYRQTEIFLAGHHGSGRGRSGVGHGVSHRSGGGRHALAGKWLVAWMGRGVCFPEVACEDARREMMA